MQPTIGFVTPFGTDGATTTNISPEDAVLYVGNLHSEADEQLIYQHFLPYGKVQSVVIKKSSYTGESRGFCFVNFSNGEDARKAKEALNHLEIMGKEIRICFKKDFKNLDPEANVYVKNLSEAAKGKALEDEFAVFGSIFSCVIRYGDDGKSLGYGYVQFKEKESAEKAIQSLNGKAFLGKSIVVQKFNPKRSRPVANWKTNLFMKNLPKGWTEDKVDAFIKDKFTQFGTVTSTCVKFCDKIGRFFAFIAFEKDEDASKAQKALNDLEVEGDQLYVGLAQKKTARRRQLAEEFSRHANETNLFIKSLKEEVTESMIRECFGEFGEITSVAVRLSAKVPKSIESHGVKLKFGFINFKEEKDAKNAFVEAKKSKKIRQLVSEHHDDNKDFLYFAQPRTVRDQYLRMVRKNLQATNMLQTQMNMFKMMMQAANSSQPKPRAGNQGAKRGAANRAPAAQTPAQFSPFPFPMMMNQPGFDLSALPQGMFPGFAPQGMMGMMPQFSLPNMPFQAAPAGFPAPVQVQPTAQPAQQEAAKVDMKDLDWLINNQKQFEQMDANEKRKLLGNLMYYRVAENKNVDKTLVPKITGMLIDLEVLDLSDIIEILTKDEALEDRIADALAIINDTEQ